MYVGSSDVYCRPGLGSKVWHDLGRLVDLLDRLGEIFGDRGVVLLLEIGQVPLDDANHHVVVSADVARLDQQALLQGASRHAHRIELLNLAQHALGQLHRHLGLFRQLLERLLQVAVGGQVADDQHRDAVLLAGEVGQLELPLQVVEQGRAAGQRRLQRRQVVVVRLVGRHGRRLGLVVEVGVPVEVGDRLARARVGLHLGGRIDLVGRDLRHRRLGFPYPLGVVGGRFGGGDGLRAFGLFIA